MRAVPAAAASAKINARSPVTRPADGLVTGAQPWKAPDLLRAGHHEQHAARPVEHRVRQRHPPVALIGLRQRDIEIGFYEDRIAGHQRCGVTVRPESQMHEIETAGVPANVPSPAP